MPIWLDMAPRTDIKGSARLQLAAGIPHARYVELPSADHLPWLADAEAIGAEIERLVAEPGPAMEPDRMLVTVMVAALGPSRRNGAIGEFRETARAEILRFRGRTLSEGGLSEAGSTILATFDGPARAVRCASAIVEASHRRGWVAKAGPHTGECDVHPEVLTGPGLDVARRVAAERRPLFAVVSAAPAVRAAGTVVRLTSP